MSRKYPQSVEAEQAVIAGMMVFTDIIPNVKEILDSSDFYLKSHEKIVEAIYDIDASGAIPDIITVSEYLKSHNTLIAAGGEEYLMTLADSVSTSGQTQYYIEIIKEHAIRRSIIISCEEISEIAFQRGSLEDLLTSYRSSMKILDPHEKTPSHIEQINQIANEIEEQSKNPNPVSGVLTGYAGIDKNMVGLEKQTTIYIKAQSQTGKSALALNIAENIGMTYDGYIPFYTLESTHRALNKRRFARATNIPLTRIRLGNLHDEYEWERFNEAIKELSKSKLHIIDLSRYRYIENIIIHLETIKRSRKYSGISLIVIDFLQLLDTYKKYSNKHERFSILSDELNTLSKDMDCPVLVLSQVNKDYDAKESGDIENNATHVWELRAEKDTEVVKLVAVKGKDTGHWSTSLRFQRYAQRFCDLECNDDVPF
ncbi:MAG: hypothetical protein GF313_08970 [Caldithrix sp.]|nr:hypothetical protein [Caldithrix sp.]